MQNLVPIGLLEGVEIRAGIFVVGSVPENAGISLSSEIWPGTAQKIKIKIFFYDFLAQKRFWHRESIDPDAPHHYGVIMAPPP